jgi:hypothetical protein
MFSSRFENTLEYLFAAALGICFFFYIFSPAIVATGAFGWMMEGDAAQHFLGWHFFRSEPWRWPLGAANHFGMDMGSSIVFSDSIPLLAIPFKTFTGILPQKFQYSGMWMLACYALQGIAGWLVAKRIGATPVQRAALATFLVVTPMTIERAMGHYALMAHWMILCAFAVYLRPSARPANWLWCALLCVAVLVHAYLFYLVFAVWIADVIHRMPTFSPAVVIGEAVHLLINLMFVAATMWLAGYFTIPFGSSIGGKAYGTYGANILSLWAPQWGSRFLTSVPVVPGNDIETDHYLGAGALLLIVIALLMGAYSGELWRIIKRNWPLVAVTTLYTVVAISNRIVAGDKVLFTVPLPPFLQSHLEFVRASGRLLWLLDFGLVILAARLCFGCFKPPIATALIVVCLVIQLLDFSPKYDGLREVYSARYFEPARHWRSPLESPFWQTASQRYEVVRYVPNGHGPAGYEPIALWAADHGMSISTGHFARLDIDKVYAAWQKDNEAVESGHTSPNSLYIFNDQATAAKAKLGPTDWLGVIDGYTVLAPGWNQ